MSDYALKTKLILEQVDATETALPMKNSACRSKFFFHHDPTPRVCLFLHGFTAGPYQFEPLGQALFEAGYNVLIPRQPGHGQAGDWHRHCPPPLPTDLQVYQTFGLEWLQTAQTLGDQVIVGGLSTGATLAAWLAFTQPQQVFRALLFAPYLSSSLKLVDGLVQLLPVYFEWFNKDAPGNFGYDGFRLPALKIFLKLGQDLLAMAKQLPAVPMLLVTSEADRVANRSDQRQWFQALLNHQPQTWFYCFKRSLKIRHRMMTKMEGNDYQDWVILLTQAYLESDLSWNQLQALAQQRLSGQTFPAAVAQLQLQAQVGPALEELLATSMACDRFQPSFDLKHKP